MSDLATPPPTESAAPVTREMVENGELTHQHVFNLLDQLGRTKDLLDSALSQLLRSDPSREAYVQQLRRSGGLPTA